MATPPPQPPIQNTQELSALFQQLQQQYQQQYQQQQQQYEQQQQQFAALVNQMNDTQARWMHSFLPPIAR